MEDRVYGDPNMKGSSNSNVPHKIFDIQVNEVNNDMLTRSLLSKYEEIKNGMWLEKNSQPNTWFAKSGSDTTAHASNYNVFQIHDINIHKLFKNLKKMLLEACEYYNIDFEKTQYMCQGWFNVNYNKVGKLDWHDHGGGGAPFFHGYYCVKAEPSITHYRIFEKEFENINKDGRAILSETGHPHAMGDWTWDGPRITIAYDFVPLSSLSPDQEQHWIPVI